jgi:hypothetical protein
VRRARIDGKPRAQACRAQLVRMAEPEGHGEEERRPHHGVPGAPTAIVECLLFSFFNYSLTKCDRSFFDNSFLMSPDLQPEGVRSTN